MGLTLPLLLLLVLGFRLEFIMVGMLHALDLGVAGNIAGKVMWKTIQNPIWCAAKQEANVAMLEADMLVFYKEHKAKSRWQGTLIV